MLDLGGDRAGGRVRADRVGRAEQQHVGTVGEHDERDHLAGLRRLERVGEQEGGVRGAGVADRGREVVDECFLGGPEPGAHGPARPERACR